MYVSLNGSTWALVQNLVIVSDLNINLCGFQTSLKTYTCTCTLHSVFCEKDSEHCKVLFFVIVSCDVENSDKIITYIAHVHVYLYVKYDMLVDSFYNVQNCIIACVVDHLCLIMNFV